MRLHRTAVAAVSAFALVMATGALGSTSKASPSVKWHHKCFSQYYFCADFPYVDGSKLGFQYQVFNLPLGSSATGKEPDFASNIYRNSRTGQFCLSLMAPGCVQSEVDEGYSVSVFRSKFADPRQAITAINGGVKDPVMTNVQGNLAVIIPIGIYGARELVIYHRGLVYYAMTTNFGQLGAKPLFTKRFLASITLT